MEVHQESLNVIFAKWSSTKEAALSATRIHNMQALAKIKLSIKIVNLYSLEILTRNDTSNPICSAGRDESGQIWTSVNKSGPV